MKRLSIIGALLALVATTAVALTPNDPQFGLQTGLTTIKVESAWVYETGGNTTKVAMIGTGLGFTSTVIADIPATVFVTSDAPDPYDDDTSSTGVTTASTSIAFATGNNASEIAGIDWVNDANALRVYKVNREGHDPVFNDEDIAEAVNAAVAWGAQVIQIDPTIIATSPLTLLAVNAALFQDRIVVIGTASFGSGLGYLPVNAGPELLVVGAGDVFGNPSGADGEGPQLDLTAPGTHIWARANSSCCTYFNQPSASAAFVTGVAALLRDRQVGEWNTRRALLDSATDLGVPGKDDQSGYGLLNAKCAFAVAGDMTDNRNVDTSDAVAVLNQFGLAGESKYNIDGAGVVDTRDVLIDLALFGANCL